MERINQFTAGCAASANPRSGERSSMAIATLIAAVIAADAAPLRGLVRSSATNTVTQAAVRLTG
jgi:uncharacterized membrane protein YedE/YeeE